MNQPITQTHGTNSLMAGLALKESLGRYLRTIEEAKRSIGCRGEPCSEEAEELKVAVGKSIIRRIVEIQERPSGSEFKDAT